MVVEPSWHSARPKSLQGITPQPSVTPAPRLLLQGSGAAGVELPPRDVNLTQAHNREESHTKSSSSASVHRPEVVGPNKTGTTYYGSIHLRGDIWQSITDTEGLSFRDAGDMRSGAVASCLEVNSYVTEANAVPEDKNQRDTQGSVVRMTSAGSQRDGSICAPIPRGNH